MSSNIKSILTSIALVCSGMLLRDWVTKLVTNELFNSSVREWVHNLTEPSKERSFIDSVKDFLDRWYSTIRAIMLLLMSVVLYPMIDIAIEDIQQDKFEELHKDTTDIDLPIPIDIYDKMNNNEKSFMNCLVTPKEINSSFTAIGGLKNEIKTIKKSLLPIMESDLVSTLKSQLMQAPGGILLHGPPGCGKTLMAKALAKESGINFMNVKSSDIKCCFYGKTEAKITALFSFAKKIQPVIIFIDEIDSLLRSRGSESSNELSVTRGIKNLFMQHMDGILNNGRNRVVIIGATNRTEDIDPAILRRMRPQVFIGLPNKDQRREIFQNILKNEPIDEQIDFSKLASETDGFSGSEIRDICKSAALNILEEVVSYSKSQEKFDNLQSNLEEKALCICSKVEDQLMCKLEPQGKCEKHIPEDLTQKASKTSENSKIIRIQTEDILKMVTEWKNKDSDSKPKFGMYT